MKKVIVFSIVILLSFLVLNKKVVQLSMSGKVKEQAKSNFLENRQAVVALAQNVPSVDRLKDDFESNQQLKTIADYEKLISEKEKLMSSLRLIEKANNGVITKEETAELLTLMREKIALNQIVMDLKFKDFDWKYL